MDATHWPQEIGLMKPISSSSMEELIMVPSSSSTSSTITRTPQLIERRTRPNKELALHCPRCKSTNTKFCYYNNYSLTQPRYFCKTCRRYWTEGGSLRNVPVGGGSRKNKKSTTNAASGTSPLSSSSSANVKKLPDLTTQVMNPNFNEGKDLNLSFYSNNSISNPSARPFFPAQEAAAGAVLYPSGGGFGLPSFISSTVNLPIDANIQEGGGRLMFPFEDLTQISPAFEQNRGQGTNNSSGFWNGVMGGGVMGDGTAW